MLLTRVTHRSNGDREYRLFACHDDIAEYGDGDYYSRIEILGEIEHHDVQSLWGQSCAMQAAMVESHYPEAA